MGLFWPESLYLLVTAYVRFVGFVSEACLALKASPTFLFPQKCSLENHLFVKPDGVSRHGLSVPREMPFLIGTYPWVPAALLSILLSI